MDATAQQAPSTVTDATRTPSELFKFASWLHVGAGAEDCEARESACEDPQHFHAWCRLPNQFQHQDIRERALAAKARRLRQLRDPDTDAYEILEADVAELRRAGDRDVMVDELVGKDWWKRQLAAMGNVEEREEFATVERDRERMVELRAMDPDARPKDEFEELERHLRAYGEAVESERVELERPLRDGLDGLELDELVEQIREERIAAEGSTVFMETYSKWEWFAGTYTSADPLNRRRRFEDIEALEQAAPEVIEALRQVYGEMETSLQRGPAGN